MLSVLLDALLDTAKTLPFLFGAYLLLEYLEHRAAGRFSAALTGPLGPVGGAVLGCVPQCGFSVAAANLYAGHLITPGTLLAVFLSTSDEALPVMLSSPGAVPDLLLLLGVKLVSAILFGLLTDLVCRRFQKAPREASPHDICRDCGCEHDGILRSALRHTGKVFLFLLLVNLLLGLALFLVGEETVSRLLLSGSLFQPLLTALVGFFPNCAASVLLTELYLSGSLSFGAAAAGLCTGAGVGFLVLFRMNRRPKENLALAGALYLFAVLTGAVCCLLFPGR